MRSRPRQRLGQSRRSGARISAFSSGTASFRGGCPCLQPRRRGAVPAAVMPPAKVSALFLTADVSLIEDWTARLRPAIVHLGAAPELLSPDRTADLKRKLPRSLLMRS